MRFSRRTGTARSTLFVILSSDRVEMCISLTSETGKRRIIFETGNPIDMRPGDKPLLARLQEAFMHAGEGLVTEGLTHIVSRKIAKGRFDSVEVFYGAPWYVSKGRHVTVDRADTGPITEKALQALMTKTLEGLLPPEMQRAVILEEHSHGFTINGYPVENPIGMEGKEIGMRLFISAIDAATQEAVETMLQQMFHADAIYHHSTLLPLAQSLRRMNGTPEAYFLTEISGYITEVSKIDRSMVIDTVSFPEGFEIITQNAANILNRRPEEMKSIARRPTDFGLTEEFQAAHDDALTSWSRGYAEALQTLGMGDGPRGTIIVSDAPSPEVFEREIARLGGGTVSLLSKDAYASFYDPSARADARVLTALLASL
jgi:hypothetical protein